MNADQSEQAWIVREYVNGRWQVEIARNTGLSQARICISIERFCASLGCHVKHRHYGPHRMIAAREALARYRGEFVQPSSEDFDVKAQLAYAAARHEHAWLLRAEGLTLQQVGDRFGVSRERAREMIAKFGRRVRRAMRKTHFEWGGDYQRG